MRRATKRKPSLTLAGLAGRTVEIEWRDENADWPRFRVLAVDGGMVLLRQARAPQMPGGRLDPRPFWSHMSAVETIAEIDP